MLPEQYRLKKRTAFAATYRSGTSYHKHGVTVFCGKLKQEGYINPTKIGFVVSKKIHKRAVKRNKIRRLMREAVRLYIKNAGGIFDTKYISLIFVATTTLLEKDYNYINKSINELMGMIND